MVHFPSENTHREADGPVVAGINWKTEWEAVCAERIKDRERGQQIINERDAWILDLIREKKAAYALLRRAVKEAVPDAMIFASHTDQPRYRKALDDLRAWTAEVKVILDAEDRSAGYGAAPAAECTQGNPND